MAARSTTSPAKPAKKRTATKAAAKPAKKVATPRPAKSPTKSVSPSRKTVAKPSALAQATRRMVAAAAAACEDKKAEEIRILELDAADAGFTDFFLIAGGANERQTQSIADEVELRLKREYGAYSNSVEGKRLGEWILLDYVDFVVHIFLAEKRRFYDIERLRKSAKHVDAQELQKALKQKTASVRKRVAQKESAASQALR